MFFSTHLCLFEWKTCLDIFVKSHESIFSIVIEMIESIHIQYMIKYFIKFYNYLNNFKSIFALYNIFLQHLNFHKYIF